MDKGKMYDEAVDKAIKYLYDTEKNMSTEFFNATEHFLTEIFPQLKKHKDELIRKRLIEFFGDDGEWSDHISYKDVRDWLERQEIPFDKGEISDGYHTFNELYQYRMLYNAAFFNLLPKEWVHKSRKHSDGEDCFGGGWFIVMANLPTGQISNHYEMEYWDLFKIPEKFLADKWDGHTPQEAAERLHSYLAGNNTIDYNSLLQKAYKRGYDEGSKYKEEPVRPMYRPGEWIVTKNGSVWKIVAVGEMLYHLKSQGGAATIMDKDDVEKHARLWNLIDAKDGDILNANGAIFDYAGYDSGYICYRCLLSIDGRLIRGSGRLVRHDKSQPTGLTRHIRPATEGECNKLRQAIVRDVDNAISVVEKASSKLLGPSITGTKAMTDEECKEWHRKHAILDGDGHMIISSEEIGDGSVNL